MLLNNRKQNSQNFVLIFQSSIFQFTISANRVDYIVTNDKIQKTAQTVQDVYSMRWVIENMHREIKQLTGIEKCQCRKQRIQRNHIACAFLVWAFLKRTAHKTKETIYRVKHGWKHLVNK